VDSNLSVLRANISLWTERWFLSSNAKDIGTLYLIFALFSGLLGTAFSVLIRLELSGPGVQYIADNQLYNAIITAHAILMIFFMVENFRLNFKSQPCLNTEKISDDNNNILIIGKANDNGGNKNYPEPKQKYVKILVKDPFNNRDLILKVTKKQKGVISIISLKLSLLVLSIVFTLYLAVTSLLFIYFFTDIFTLPSTLSLQYAAIPLLVYDNTENQRKEIIKDNSNKSGIYRWINKVNGKCYVGSSVDLGYRLKQYYSYKYLTRKKSISSISSALIKYGHSNFILEILEHCEPEK